MTEQHYTGEQIEILRAQLNAHFDDLQADWDSLIAGKADEQTSTANSQPGGPTDTSLWGGMPAIDSKAVARAASIFEKVLSIKFDARAIKPGGYQDVDELVAHIIPELIKLQPKEESKGV